ncbi:sec-independent protein translocase protein TatC [Actinocorallia herbida]|uniref:Sec-independent protein translocase protein TatC n=1 Tax=Actinocorallia herbida TaxID=58109 RepID=A0A3N1D4G0_9ACTN|nr:twin-arginine translocase subunit TatC [Actinocorallia herbida]ROO88424.1 sec-independent protein translocase protein TatC [Actinocorallia herbida]
MSGRSDNPDGRMPLLDHLRELRNRVVKALLGLLVGMVIGWLVKEEVWDFLREPFCAVDQSRALKGDACSLVVNGIFSSFFLNVKISFIVGAVLSSPVWLYQLWAFIAPGLHSKEKRWTVLFLGLALPLFLAGTALAYFAIERGLALFLGFTPDDVTPLITVEEYLSFLITMLLVFGLAFELPLVVSILNFAGVLPHATIRKWRRGIIFGIFLFAAVATPSADPFTMVSLAAPVVVLFALAEGIAYLVDKRRAKAPSLYDGLSDDEASALDDEPSDIGEPEALEERR